MGVGERVCALGGREMGRADNDEFVCVCVYVATKSEHICLCPLNTH